MLVGPCVSLITPTKIKNIRNRKTCRINIYVRNLFGAALLVKLRIFFKM